MLKSTQALRTVFVAICLTVLACTGPVAGPSLARAPGCAGKNLLAQMKTDAPGGYAKVMAAAAKYSNSRALLWRIEGKGMKKPSFLFGTVHITDPRVTNLPKPVINALNQSESVALEIKEIVNTGGLMKAFASHVYLMVVKPGSSLSEMLTADQRRIVDGALKKAGVSLSGMDQFQPWMPAMTLSLPLCETIRAATGKQAVDQVIGQYALTRKIQLYGLETVREQLSIFASMPAKDQLAFLVATAMLYDKSEDMLETMIQLYLARNVAAIMPLNEALLPASLREKTRVVITYFNKVVINKRNHTMSVRAQKIMAEKSLFIAVGAMHLPGDQGLVALLRKAGYRLTAIY